MEPVLDKIEVLERLEAGITACEEALNENTQYEVNFDQVLALARKIAPGLLPPQGLRYSPDQGPLEALPGRFRLPFPSQDEMRLSSVFVDGNKSFSSSTPPEQSNVLEPDSQILKPGQDEDEFAEDF